MFGVPQLALTIEDRQPEQDSVEGDLLGHCILETLIDASPLELLAPVQLGRMRNHLRHRRLDEAVRTFLRCCETSSNVALSLKLLHKRMRFSFPSPTLTLNS